MHKTAMGVILALSFAALSYAALMVFGGIHSAPAKALPAKQASVRRTPAEIAARDHMAQLVAEVAARSAARTAKSVAQSRMAAQAPQPAVPATGPMAEQKTASR